MRRLISLLALISPLALAPVLAAGLNDTGMNMCFDGSMLVPCTEDNTGDTARYPRQDARFGRDAAAAAGQLTKIGGGAAGFDYTWICNSGEAAGTGACPTIPVLGAGANDWACTRDNVTGLIWEVKTDDGGLRDKDWTYQWGVTTGGGSCNGALTSCNSESYINAVNASPGLCGAIDWRLPTRRELLSIVNLAFWSPSIDSDYFPNTFIPGEYASMYWTSDTYAANLAQDWVVNFDVGNTYVRAQETDHPVRLVRGGP